MFLFPSLLWIGLPLVALPVLIHLINLMRQRRVKWAAMDFLLQSQKRHKRWIVLKQLLLLLLRMGAVATVAFMLAQPLLKNAWGELFGGTETHHVVLLDDSFSMSDRWADGSAFELAKEVVHRLAEQAARQGSRQSFSLLRFSAAGTIAGGSQPDLLQENVDADLIVELEKLLGQMQPSQSAAGPAGALDAVRRLPSKSEDENRILYCISDFRTREWNEPTELRKTLDELNEAATKIHLVHCVDAVRTNLAVTDLKPLTGTRAAGVELFMEVAVKNFGEEPVREVSVRLDEDGHSRPGLLIDSIAAGETVARRFTVNYPVAGQHTIAASLASDAVLTDNDRFFVLDVPDTVPALIIDGAPRARDAYFLSAGLAPGGKVRTGVTPRIEPPQFLRKRDELAKFHAIYLLNLDHLDATEIESLEEYVRAGGGVAFFLGELSQSKFFNEALYRDGEGLFPLPLALPTDLLPQRTEKSPDLEVIDHPIFHTFLTMRNNPLDDVLVQRYFAVPEAWKPEPDSTVEVIARLRNGAPLGVEKRFGQGRVVAFLTKASPEQTSLGTWNNWSRNHSYLPTMLSVQGYLASGRKRDESRFVGQPLSLVLDANRYESQVRFTTPSDDTSDGMIIDAAASPDGLQAALSDTPVSGVYTAHLRTTKGQDEARFFAYNVSAEEGDLHMLDGLQLASRLKGLEYRFYRAQDLRYDPQDLAAFNLSDGLLYLLIVVLIGEQILAYSASYHPPRREVAHR